MTEEQQRELSSFIGRLLRATFGKGPESIVVSSAGPYLTIYLNRFLSATERILLAQDSEEIVIGTRTLLMQQVIPEIRTVVSLVTGEHLGEVYYDWSLTNQSGMIVCVATQPFTSNLEAAMDAYPGCQQLHDEVNAISQQVQKLPESTTSCFVSPRTLLVIRTGLLVAIEKELIRLGHEAALKHAKWSLEKRYFHNDIHLPAILQRQITDVFVDWDFQSDKSIIAFILSQS